MRAWCWVLLAATGAAPLACGGGDDKGDPHDPAAGAAGTGESGASSVAGADAGGASAGGEGNATGGSAAGQGGEDTSTGGTDGGTGAVSGASGSDTGGAAGASGMSGAGAEGGNPSVDPPFPCENPVPVGGDGSGVFRCDNGMVHRASNETCDVEVGEDPGASSEPAADDCVAHADCDAMPYGRCLLGPTGANVCEYGCASDADCETTESCLCGETMGQCVKRADCATDADCDAGYHCVSLYTGTNTTDPEGECWYALTCQRPDDTCGGDNDCTAGTDQCGRFTDEPDSGERSLCQAFMCVVP